ncbi:hypothetical protein QZH41_004086 [Actinostola sp. cb2023]|nr:hypothetical protein QZH41_004086 [Actinostola sp. cb2023]
MAGRDVHFVKQTPAFIKNFKNQMGYKEPDDVESKFEKLEKSSKEDDEDHDCEKPTVVLGSNVTEEEANEFLAQRQEEERDDEEIDDVRIPVRIPRVPQDPQYMCILKQVFKVAFVQARKLRILSFTTLEPTESTEVTNFNGARQSVASIGRIERRRRKSIIRELKATKTLAIVVGTFILCWLPFFVIMFIVQFCPECYQTELSPVAQLGIGTVFVYVLPLLNSAVNPIIYSSFNTDFRRAFRDILFRLCALNRRNGQSDMQARSMGDFDMDYTFQTNNLQNDNYKLPVNIYHNGDPPKIVIPRGKFGERRRRRCNRFKGWR